MQVIKEVGVVSLGKIAGVSGLLIGLIVGVPFGLFMILMGAIGGAAASAEGADLAGGALATGIGGGLMLMIIFPIFYGTFSFLGGLIYALILNLVFRLAGGLEVRIENQ